MDIITNYDVKKSNHNNIYKTIYQEKNITKQQLATKLQLSLPTITQNLKELTKMQLIYKGDFLSPSINGGRKAQLICCNKTARIAVGVEILRKQVYIIAVDLYGTPLGEDTLKLSFKNDESCFKSIGKWVNQFIEALSYPPETVLGVGISIQGLVSREHTKVLNGDILNCTGLNVKELSQYINWPCSLNHDVKAAAYTELWFNKELKDALFFWLNANLGAALIVDGKIHEGRSSASGTLEHMCLYPDGRPCYCGKKGCVESYCSVDALLEHAQEDITVFFQLLREGDQRHLHIWREYLHNLAMAINNAIRLIDCDVIFSGLLAHYLREEDLEQIEIYLEQMTPFSFCKPHLRIGVSNKYAAAIGAALMQITDFFEKGEIFNKIVR